MSDLCTCNNQLQPHERRRYVCPPNWDEMCDDCGRDDGTHDEEVEH